MVFRLEFPADFHYPNGQSQTTYEAALDRINSRGQDMIVWGGDQVASAQNFPEFDPQDVRDFWSTVEARTDMSITHQVPGNHDIPVPYYHEITSEYLPDERTHLPRTLQPTDGLTVILMNSNGNLVDGGVSGVGQDYPYIPISDAKFMIEAVKDAHSRGDVVVIATHAPFWFAPASRSGKGTNSVNDLSTYAQDEIAMRVMSVNPEAEANGQVYFTCHNYHQIMQELAKNSPAVVLSGHIFQAGYEDYQNVNGVRHTFQAHYGALDGTESSYLDIDLSTGNVVYKTVPKGGGTHNTIMDITPSW